MSKENFKAILRPRRPSSHKGDYGHVFVLAGSLGLTGAAYLSCRACLLSGSGLVTLGIAKSLNPIMEVKLTEVMTKPLHETRQSSPSLRALAQIKKLLPKIDALAIGPGISRNRQTKKLVHKLLSSIIRPAVLDADGINALVGKLKILHTLKSRLVITPHEAEMAGLLGLRVAQVQENRVNVARDFARRHKLTVVLKGHHSVVSAADGTTYINQTGNPGMASGGCGDVLTGMIASFLGQGIKPFQAAKLGVYLHGLAGDYAAREKGQSSLIAADLLDNLPRALKTVV